MQHRVLCLLVFAVLLVGVTCEATSNDSLQPHLEDVDESFLQTSSETGITPNWKTLKRFATAVLRMGVHAFIGTIKYMAEKDKDKDKNKDVTTIGLLQTALAEDDWASIAAGSFLETEAREMLAHALKLDDEVSAEIVLDRAGEATEECYHFAMEAKKTYKNQNSGGSQVSPTKRTKSSQNKENEREMSRNALIEATKAALGEQSLAMLGGSIGAEHTLSEDEVMHMLLERLLQDDEPVGNSTAFLETDSTTSMWFLLGGKPRMCYFRLTIGLIFCKFSGLRLSKNPDMDQMTLLQTQEGSSSPFTQDYDEVSAAKEFLGTFQSKPSATTDFHMPTDLLSPFDSDSKELSLTRDSVAKDMANELQNINSDGPEMGEQEWVKNELHDAAHAANLSPKFESDVAQTLESEMKEYLTVPDSAKGAPGQNDASKDFSPKMLAEMGPMGSGYAADEGLEQVTPPPFHQPQPQRGRSTSVPSPKQFVQSAQTQPHEPQQHVQLKLGTTAPATSKAKSLPKLPVTKPKSKTAATSGGKAVSLKKIIGEAQIANEGFNPLDDSDKAADEDMRSFESSLEGSSDGLAANSQTHSSQHINTQLQAQSDQKKQKKMLTPEAKAFIERAIWRCARAWYAAFVGFRYVVRMYIQTKQKNDE